MSHEQCYSALIINTFKVNLAVHLIGTTASRSSANVCTSQRVKLVSLLIDLNLVEQILSSYMLLYVCNYSKKVDPLFPKSLCNKVKLVKFDLILN